MAASAVRPARALDPPLFIRLWGCEDQRGFFGGCFGTLEEGDFVLPQAIAVDASGDLYVADTYNHRVQRFTADGEFALQWGSYGSGPGEFREPRGIAVDESGFVYVGDTVNHRIQKFSLDGTYVGEWGSPGAGDGELARPKAIDLDANGSLYVVDSGNYRVQKFSTDGVFLLNFGTLGWGEGEFVVPLAVATDGDRVLVSDLAHGVQEFGSDGAYVGPWGSCDGQPLTATGMHFDPDGDVYIAEAGDHRVQILSGAGECLAQWGGFGEDPGQFHGPTDVCVGPGGLVYVVDRVNSRIQEFGFVTLVTTDPPGLQIVADGVEYTSPAPFEWVPGSLHTIGTVFHQEESGQATYDFTDWSDGGELVHSITVPESPTAFIADFDVSFWLTMVADPEVAVMPESRWVPEGRQVVIRAQPLKPYGTIEWEGTGPGSYSGIGATATIVMDGPITETARLTHVGLIYDFTISASPTDPFASAGEPTHDLRNLYFWMTCAPSGISALETGTTGTLTPLGFHPLNGVLNAGDAVNPLLAVPGCPIGPQVNFLLGYWIVWDDGGSFCLAPSDANGILGAVHCDPIDPVLVLDPYVRGFDSGGDTPCAIGVNGCTAGNVAAAPGRDGPLSPTTPRDAAGGRVVFLGVRPNPFGGSTELSFALPRSERVDLSIYDVTGRLVRRLVSGPRAAGVHREFWDGRTADGAPAPSGVYFSRFTAGEVRRTGKITLVRR